MQTLTSVNFFEDRRLAAVNLAGKASLVLLLLGALIVLSQGSAVAPFIYTLF